MATFKARRIQADEYEAYRRIGGYAYGFWKDELDDWTPDPSELANRLAVFIDGTMSAKLICNSYEQVVRGQWRSAGAIGGVATLPEFRRQGHVRKLMDATFAHMREQNQAVSALYPFSQPFYAKFGYVRTNPILRVRFDSAALSHLIPLVDDAGSTWRYERIPAIQGVEQYKQFLYEVAQSRRHPSYNGYMRNPGLDAGDLANEHMVFVWQQDEKGGLAQITAAALYRTEKYADPDGATLINDCHWRDAHSRDRLLAFVALHAAGMPKVQVSLAPNVNFHGWLSDHPLPYEAKLSQLPLMVRVMDVVHSLSDIQVDPSPHASFLKIRVTDPICPWVSGTFTFEEESARLRVQRADGDAPIQMTIDGITALAYGTLSATELVYRGWITGASGEEIDLLDRWFPTGLVFNLLGF